MKRLSIVLALSVGACTPFQDAELTATHPASDAAPPAPFTDASSRLDPQAVDPVPAALWTIVRAAGEAVPTGQAAAPGAESDHQGHHHEEHR